MRAAVLREPGPAENLRLEDVDDPTPGPGEVVVRLRAAALNHRDVWIRSGTGAYAGGFRQRVILGSDGHVSILDFGLALLPGAERITLAGALFLTIIAVIPILLSKQINIPPDVAQFFGGTSILIAVGVMLDTMRQVESHLMMRHYDGFLKKGKIRGRF